MLKRPMLKRKFPVAASTLFAMTVTAPISVIGAHAGPLAPIGSQPEASRAIAATRTTDGYERREPAAGAPAHKVFAWTAKCGLRYTWVVPKDYDGKAPRNLTVILHGTGLDYQWGHANNPAGVFRPDDIVVSVDGTSPGEGMSRLFLGEKKDAEAFKTFLEEMKKTFAVDSTFLYGHSQGSFFVVYFAGEHPEMVAGVVAHASGAWSFSKTPKELKKVAIAFMHGTLDPVVPYGQSPGSRDFYVKAGFDLVHLRRLPRYNHWPNAVRATEELDWCEGMTTSKAERALELALDILRVKRPDQYQWETAVGFSGARDVLRRLENKGPVPFASVDPKLVDDARKWIERIEEAGAQHVEAIKQDIGKKGDLKLDGKAWLGHLVSLREDFRGVDSVESFVKEIGYDKLLESQRKAADAIIEAWYNGKETKTIVEAILENISKAFLVEGLPAEIADKMKEWENQKIALPAKTLKRFSEFDDWKKGWDDGLKQYASIWKKWKGP